MAHSLSSKKRIRQNASRNDRNRTRRATLKSATRKFTELLSGADAAKAGPGEFRKLAALVDQAANRKTLHRNAAARRKSRLAKRLNAVLKGAK